MAGFFLLALAWAGSVFSLRAADKGKTEDWNQSTLLYLPSGKLLKPMALDFDEAVADLLWIQGILYFADQYLQDQKYEWMGHILEIITTLNPHFYHAYEFGGTVLARNQADLSETAKLLERGIQNFPDDWRLRLFEALVYMKKDSNYTAAAEVLQPISLLPGVPDYVRTFSATLLEKGSGDKMALAFLMDSYLHSPDAINREIFLDRILKLYPPGMDNSPRKETVRKLLSLVQADPRSEGIIRNVVREYLNGSVSPGSKRVLKLLGQ